MEDCVIELLESTPLAPCLLIPVLSVKLCGARACAMQGPTCALQCSPGSVRGDELQTWASTL